MTSLLTNFLAFILTSGRRQLVAASEGSGVGEQRAGLQQQTLGVDPDSVEHGEEVLRAEQSVRQGEAQRGRDEAPAVLHHPRAGAPLDRRGLANSVHDRVASRRRRRRSRKRHPETQTFPQGQMSTGLPG